LTMAATIVAMIISTILVIPPIEAISVEECCRHEGVPDICVRTLCNPVSVGGGAEAFGCLEDWTQ
jgi:hypothetical protein